MKMLLKRYRYFLVLLVINIVVYGLYPSVGQKSIDITWSNAVEMLSVIPPIFILLGLDVWGGYKIYLGFNITLAELTLKWPSFRVFLDIAKREIIIVT